MFVQEETKFGAGCVSACCLKNSCHNGIEEAERSLVNAVSRFFLEVR